MRRNTMVTIHNDEIYLKLIKLEFDDFVNELKGEDLDPTSLEVLATMPRLADSKWLEFKVYARSFGFEVTRKVADVSETTNAYTHVIITAVYVRKLQDETTKLA